MLLRTFFSAYEGVSFDSIGILRTAKAVHQKNTEENNVKNDSCGKRSLIIVIINLFYQLKKYF